MSRGQREPGAVILLFVSEKEPMAGELALKHTKI